MKKISLAKVVLNMGIGEGKDDAKLIDKAVSELSLISGQKAIKTKACRHYGGYTWPFAGLLSPRPC